MKQLMWSSLLLFFLLQITNVRSQDIPPVTQQQLEDLSEKDQQATGDDSWLQDLDNYKRHPLNINTADETDLKQLHFLSELQVINFFRYRYLLGNFISLYELQAIPGWDLATVRKIVPFLTLQNIESLSSQLKNRFSKGDYSLITRISQVLQKADGYKNGHYAGSPQKLFFRLKYNYKNILQWGITGDKDAGEQFFKGKQRSGFDLYSFHFFLRKMGCIRSLVIGDFTVNMGQGLIQWQSLAFKKGTEVINIKRQSEILRPYSSSGEYFFNRGAGITIDKRHFQVTGFVSRRTLSSTIKKDTISDLSFVSSFQQDGYHRTKLEDQDRNNLRQLFYGGNVSYGSGGNRIGLNFIGYDLSMPLMKAMEPYNIYSLRGKKWFNSSVDLSYTFRNCHLFGEWAADNNFNTAFLAGTMISVDRKIDLSFLYRNIAGGYQALNGNAFTEGTLPSNEKGFYAGLSIKPNSTWTINTYADVFTFPWLRYRVDAPSSGKEYLIQVTYDPDKQTEIYCRFHSQTKEENGGTGNTYAILPVTSNNWRFHISKKINNDITIRQRAEITSYFSEVGTAKNGFLCYADLLYHPLQKPYGLDLRFQYFETGGYESRVYAYENDVLYNFSIPYFSGKGMRYYFLLSYDLSRKISVWLRWASSIFPGTDHTGDGDARIDGNKVSEIKVQMRCLF